jgi:hypothetical protein
MSKQGEVAPGDVFGWLAKTPIERRLPAARLARRSQQQCPDDATDAP